jgi:hypothetical protein
MMAATTGHIIYFGNFYCMTRLCCLHFSLIFILLPQKSERIHISNTCIQPVHVSSHIAVIILKSFINYLPAAVAQATDIDSFRSGLEGIQFKPAFM